MDAHWLTSSELLAHFRQIGLPCSRRTMHRWIEAGMPAHQPGGERGRYLFDRDEVERWIRSRCIASDRGTPRHRAAS